MLIPLPFTKVEGAGNDYVLVDADRHEPCDPSDLAKRVCDRHFGIGADGLLLVGAPEPGVDAHARMRIYNSDGSEGRMCGNGLRCVVDWWLATGRAPAPGEDGVLRVQTASGPRTGRRRDDGLIETGMGRPDFRPEAVPVEAPGDPPAIPLPDGVEGKPDRGFCVSVGNPHVVVAVTEPEDFDLPTAGAALSRAPALPVGANAHLVVVVGPARVRVRTWELGAGATLACGTGAVAVAAVARKLGWVDGDEITVSMPGGDLVVRWDGQGAACLAGPARRVFEGVLPVPGAWLVQAPTTEPAAP